MKGSETVYCIFTYRQIFVGAFQIIKVKENKQKNIKSGFQRDPAVSKSIEVILESVVPFYFLILEVSFMILRIPFGH